MGSSCVSMAPVQCGAITYEAELDPQTVGVCHCTDCQTLTRSPGVRAAMSDLRIGVPRIDGYGFDSGCIANASSATGWPPIRCSWMMRSSTAGVQPRYHVPSG